MSLDALPWWVPPVLGPLLYIVFGLGMAFGGVLKMRRDGSPFVKIFRDAVDVFVADPRLSVLPVAMGLSIVLGAGLVCQLLIDSPDLLARIARHCAPLADMLVRSGLALLVLCAAGAQLAGLGVAVANAVLAESFLERCHGRPANFAAAVGRVLVRLPRLLGFTFLWCALLALITIVRMELQIFVLRVQPGMEGRLKAVAIEFAGFALETGLVMAAYLMLVVMLREDIGPLTAMSRTLQVVKREYASTIGELASVKIVDEGMKWVIIGAAVVGQMASMWAWSAYFPTASVDFVSVFVMVSVMGSGLLIGGSYYSVIQTLQLLLACAVFLFVHDGIMVPGFDRADFENVLCLKVSALPEGVTGAARS